MPPSLSCQFQPWLTEIWLLLSVISNSIGSILTSTLFFHFPCSWLASVLFISFSRIFFNISPKMPILLDLGISLFFQYVVLSSKNGWEIAVSLGLLVNSLIFYGGYFVFVSIEYTRLKKANPNTKASIKPIIHPLSPENFCLALMAIHILNPFFFFLTWAFPLSDGCYQIWKLLCGVFMVYEGLIFLNCYKNVTATKDSVLAAASAVSSTHSRKCPPIRKPKAH